MSLRDNGPNNGDFARYVELLVARQAAELRAPHAPVAMKRTRPKTAAAPAPIPVPRAAPAATPPDLHEVLRGLWRRWPIVLVAGAIGLPILWDMLEDWPLDELAIFGVFAAIIAFKWWRKG